MIRIRNPSQLKNMCRPNIIQKNRGSHYDDQSFSLTIDVQLLLNFSQETQYLLTFGGNRYAVYSSSPLKNKMVYFVLDFFKKGLTTQPQCVIIQMLSEAQTL